MTISSLVAIGIGGAIGAMARFGLSNILGLYAILTINIFGCFFMGALVSVLAAKTSFNQTIMLLLSVGLLGGFTTFSNFALETIQMADNQKYVAALVYVMISVGGGLTAFIFGRFLVKTIL